MVVSTQEQSSARRVIDEWFDLYADDVFRFSLWLTGNRDDARDTVQEVFFRAHQGLSDFRHDASPKTWLFRIARNYVHDVHRKRRSDHRHIQQHRARDRTGATFEDQVALYDALSRLPDNYRQVVVLRFAHDLSIQDTSQVLGWSSEKVRTTQHRALKRLKELLNDDY